MLTGALRKTRRPSLGAPDGVPPHLEDRLSLARLGLRGGEAGDRVTDHLRFGPSRAPRQGAHHPLRLRIGVESRTSAVAYRTGGADYERRLSLSLSPRSPSLRFSSPLIEPDVTISVIRLSDGFHGRHSQARAAEVGQETERPAPRRRP